jgi:hypothetical protein
VTHETTPNDEAGAGPETDHRLPDAASIPVFDDPGRSDAPPLTEAHSLTVAQARTELGVDPEQVVTGQARAELGEDPGEAHWPDHTGSV